MAIILEIIIIILLVFLTDLLTYKYIKFLDNRERKKLAQRENARIQELLDKFDNDQEKIIKVLGE